MLIIAFSELTHEKRINMDFVTTDMGLRGSRYIGALSLRYLSESLHNRYPNREQNAHKATIAKRNCPREDE